METLSYLYISTLKLQRVRFAVFHKDDTVFIAIVKTLVFLSGVHEWMKQWMNETHFVYPAIQKTLVLSVFYYGIMEWNPCDIINYLMLMQVY